MAGLLNGANTKGHKQEVIARQQVDQSLALEEQENVLLAIGKRLVDKILVTRTSKPKNVDTPNAHNQDASENQLWRIHNQQQMRNPKPPMDIFR